MDNKTETTIRTYCESNVRSKPSGGQYVYNRGLQYDPQNIIFQPNFSKNFANFLILNRNTKNYHFYSPLNYTLFNDINDCMKHCIKISKQTESKCENVFCFVPEFIQQIDEELLKQTDGIIEYSSTDPKIDGLLFLFNINGTPKFCFKHRNQNFNSEVFL